MPWPFLLLAGAAKAAAHAASGSVVTKLAAGAAKAATTKGAVAKGVATQSPHSQLAGARRVAKQIADKLTDQVTDGLTEKLEETLTDKGRSKNKR
jgi:hypothetical protein